MTRPRLILCTIFLVAVASASAGWAQLLGSVHAGTYGERHYEEIDGVELSSRRMFSTYNYDVVIPDTTLGDPMILCRLYDSNDAVVASSMKGANTRETYMHFRTATADATARCFYSIGERLTRPSGPTPQ